MELIEQKLEGVAELKTWRLGNQTTDQSGLYVACSSLAKKNIKSDSRV
jgi:hypothetical protein